MAFSAADDAAALTVLARFAKLLLSAICSLSTFSPLPPNRPPLLNRESQIRYMNGLFHMFPFWSRLIKADHKALLSSIKQKV